MHFLGLFLKKLNPFQDPRPQFSTPTATRFIPGNSKYTWYARENTHFKASFEGVSETLKGARWCADHSTDFMITLAKAAGLCSEKVFIAESPLFPQCSWTCPRKAFPRRLFSVHWAFASLLYLEKLNQFCCTKLTKNTNEPMLIFFSSVCLIAFFF